jgi:preprotein translocase subunit SecD
MHLVMEVEKDKLPPGSSLMDAVDRAIEIIRNRIDAIGVAEPVIQRQGESWIVIQLPGLDYPKKAKELIGTTALLEFKLVSERPIDDFTHSVTHGGPVASVSHDHVVAAEHHHAEHGHSHSDAPDADHESDGTSAHVHLLVDRLAHAAPVPATRLDRAPRHWPHNQPQLPSAVLAPLLEPPAA